ncbi:hypothetical protein CONLIGDRAFT_745 [Coniochaeta ligniaria NRRL 30616]|uniref:Uncharacterized protein n=1 Tax=Coniochaeta ligniaria NRRL 30616 TaxID=1408157 RepID=A0A1J7JW58_9PEZI|nr:hypothetical protein CONLIGDRAFT_745 [Coniochaeta ligniaria NRRL 30616]
MPSDVKIATARILKGGIEYARGIRGGRRSGLVLGFTVFFFFFLLHRVGSRIHHEPGPNPYRSQHPSSWWPTGSSADKYTGPAGAKTGASAADKAYSVKPIAYIFPQFHPIPENDEFWSVNFTEWTNVKKVTTNAWGIEIQQPTDEVGYYNLLDYSTRSRYAKHARDSGLYGFVYHHYWFGRPVMEKVLTSMLEDGQPDTPFMLNWANEPWTARWDGNDASKILLKQTYGDIDAWREHFNWLLPFFRHPNQIRVNGKVQFMVYNGIHMHDAGKRMYSAWRKWAIEEGLGGLDIIETRIQPDNPEERGLTDAVNEFGFRSGGGHDGTTWASINRLGKVYHRGAAVSFDNTPRHPADGGAATNIFAHPSLWKFHILNLIRRIKLDPNPQGEENFLFINAFNEWGEGNVLEPSKQWGANFSAALHEAVELGHSIPWKDDLIEQSESLAREHAITSQPGSTTKADVIPQPRHDIDVCVVVRTFKSDWQFSEAFGLSDLLRSLTAQNNPRWRAVVLRGAESADDRIVKSHVLDAFDPRVRVIDPPEAILKQGLDVRNASEWAVTDWALTNLTEIADAGLSDCGMARYLVVARSNATYAPDAFDAVDGSWSSSRAGRPAGEGDIVGLNFETTETVGAEETDMPWGERCTRLREGRVKACVPATSVTSLSVLEPGAVLIDLRKFTVGGHRFGNRGAGLLHDLVEAGWTWTMPQGSGCQMVEAGSYSSCIRSGRFWLDVPTSSTKYEAGCYSLHGITGRYTQDTAQWDMAGWKADPFCLRLSEKAYAS